MKRMSLEQGLGGKKMTNNTKVQITEKDSLFFKGLDLIKCLKNYGCRFVTLYRRQGSRPFPSKKKKGAKRKNGCLRKPYKELRKEEKLKAKEKRKDIPI